MSKEMWVLTIRTSLPEVAYDEKDLKTTSLIFQSFEDAKKALQEKLREFAFTENSMFDGEGGIVYWDFYAQVLNDEFDEDEIAEARERLAVLQPQVQRL